MSGCLGSCVVLIAACFMMIGCAAPASNEPTLRVMSFNVRCATAPDGDNDWSHRREFLIETIRKFDPDILGMQEVVGAQPADLRGGLFDYKFVGVGRDDGREAGEMSPIMFRCARFELVDYGTFWLSETPDVPGSKSWDAAITRIATWVSLRDRTSGRALLVINTHWDHVGQVARLRSAELIRDFLSRSADATIVTGDFNCTEDDPPYRALLVSSASSIQLIDSYRAMYPMRSLNEATFHAFKGTTEGSRIDFILHTVQLRAVEANIDRTSRSGKYPSDHFAVTTVLERVSETAKKD